MTQSGNKYKEQLLLQYKILIIILLIATVGFTQIQTRDRDQFIIGDTEKLLITVHVWGEVKNPGQFRVQDDVNLLELISLAGGPTEFSNLKKIKLSRGEYFNQSDSNLFAEKANMKKLLAIGEKIQIINLLDYIDKKKSDPLPILGPGDVVYIPKNLWYKIQTAVRIVSQMAIVAQVWYWYSRS